MKLKQLKLENFKNYESLNVTLGDHLVCIVGLNGSGKTNLLDAIHYLIFTKSGFVSNDPTNIRKSASYFLAKGEIMEESNQSELLCYLEKGQKKIFKKDRSTYEKLSSHIGQFLGVMATPYDSELILGASEVRRKWIDGCVSQFQPSYLDNLLSYQRFLKQRNALLKKAEGSLSAQNEVLLNTYDDQIIPLAISISNARNQFLAEFLPFFSSNLNILVKEHETCTIQLKTQVLSEDFDKSFRQNRNKDVLMQRTSLGAHKDDFIFTLDDEPIKRFGSQGQQKSFLIALKLAQYDHLVDKTSRRPVLLLDDIFDKLDDERIQQLLKLLTESFSGKENIKQKGQVFITDARAERSKQLTKNIPNTQILEIEAGNLVSDNLAQ